MPLISRETRTELESAEFAICSRELDVIDAQVDGSRCDPFIDDPTECLDDCQ